MGPQASKSDPGQRLVAPAGPKAQRARQEIDYGRRDVAGYVFGALQPARGAAITAPYARRTSANWIDFLGRVEDWILPSISFHAIHQIARFGCAILKDYLVILKVFHEIGTGHIISVTALGSLSNKISQASRN